MKWGHRLEMFSWLEEHDSDTWWQRSRVAFDKFDVVKDGFIIPEDPSYSRRWDEGGDRDDNPRVTPEVTRDFCLLASMMAANLYYSQIEDLMFAVYVVMQWRVRSDELLKSSRKDVKHCIEFWEHIPPREPWHVILGDAKNKLYKVKWKQWHDMSILELRILSAGW